MPDEAYWDEVEDEAPAEELETLEELISDSATAARTVAELEAEIEILKGLEAMAYRVRHSGTDRKWEQLASILQSEPPADAGVGLPVRSAWSTSRASGGSWSSSPSTATR